MKAFILSELLFVTIALATILGMCGLLVQSGFPADIFSIVVITGGLVFGSIYFTSAVIAICKVFKGRVLLKRRIVFPNEPISLDVGILPLPCVLWLFFERSTDLYFGTIAVRVGSELHNQIASTLSLELIRPYRQRLYWFGDRRFRDVWPRYFGSHFAPLCIQVPKNEVVEPHVWIDLSLGPNGAPSVEGRSTIEQDVILVVARSLS